ncbi:MAG TPA: hypothetical protein VEL05_02700 [Candidatus Acidoferrum sp.]|nr:hypothetical protein [Candidatus Acidoferrum sp.]
MPVAALLALLVLALTTGCYENPRPPCAFACGPADDCPAGYSCRADTWCKRDDIPDDFTCGPPILDAAPPAADASAADADIADADVAHRNAAAEADADLPDASPAATMSLSTQVSFTPSQSGS